MPSDVKEMERAGPLLTSPVPFAKHRSVAERATLSHTSLLAKLPVSSSLWRIWTFDQVPDQIPRPFTYTLERYFELARDEVFVAGSQYTWGGQFYQEFMSNGAPPARETFPKYRIPY